MRPEILKLHAAELRTVGAKRKYAGPMARIRFAIASAASSDLAMARAAAEISK